MRPPFTSQAALSHPAARKRIDCIASAGKAAAMAAR